MKKIYNSLIFLLFITFSVQGQSILLVNDNGYDMTRIEALKTSLQNLDYTYTYFNAAEEGVSPSAEFMEPFDLVIWYTGNDGAGLYLWNGDESDNEEVKTYLDNGGMMWLQGLDFLYDRYGGAQDTFKLGDFVYDYLGIEYYVGQSHIDDGVYSDGVEFAEVVEDNGIFTLDSLIWTWSTLWYGDAVLPVDGAQPLYNMGPLAYDLGGIPTAVHYENEDMKVMTFGVETAKFDASWRLDSLFAQGLRYFKQFATTTKLVESISVSTLSGKDFIDTKGGSLQFEAMVLPEDATNKNVEWTLENNIANASISLDGVLTASGLSNGNGSVTVVATALDGSEVSASMDINISNQGNPEDYEILLVNDNANGTDRYLVLEDALTNNGYGFYTYNTVQTNTFPDEAFLDVFDVVIWYTGNDGVSLKLWDVSDSTDFKFNAPLKSYLDKGGIVWLQGLDFFYDIFGSAPYPEGNDEFEAGSFIYDYMGITKYVAQTYADDGNLGVAQLDLVADNPICELNPIFWTYSTLYYVDALAISDNATGIYKLGPNDYIYNPFYAAVYNRMESTKSKLLTFTFETARMDSQDNTDQLFYEVLESFRNIIANDEEVVFEQRDFLLYPNPSKHHTYLNFNLSEATKVNVSLTNLLGEQVKQLISDDFSSGAHSIRIDVSNLLPGSYLISTVINDRISTKKLIVTQ